jgi:hypothetical protein
MHRLGRVAGAVGLLWLLPALFAASTVAGAPAAPRELVGTFAITAGSCTGAVQGSYFRMMTAGGASHIENGDSPCADKTFSPLLPGSDGGLVTGAYQPAPSARFDGAGGGTADRITRPTPFFGVAFATSTESVDPQTDTAVPPPSITADDAGNLTGATAAFGAAWNNEDFNQGAPKPDGSRPGSTSGPSGTYDAATGAFTLEWTSLIVGGPFNSFTGVWHLEGTFRAQGGAPETTPAEPAGSATPAPPSGAAGVPAGADAAGEAPAADTAGAAVPPVTDTTAVEAAAPTAPREDGTLAADTAAPVRVSREGWRPATWLVVLTAALGVSAVVALLYLSRAGVRAAP